jgi:hypothetical protein
MGWNSDFPVLSRPVLVQAGRCIVPGQKPGGGGAKPVEEDLYLLIVSAYAAYSYVNRQTTQFSQQGNQLTNDL